MESRSVIVKRRTNDGLPTARRRWLAGRIVFWGLLIALAYGCAKSASSESQKFIAWASTHAVPIDDLDSPLAGSAVVAFRSAVGFARVVGLGESRHDTREQHLLKSQLVRQLVEDLGFRTLIIEESFHHVESLDRFVTTGEGDLRQIMNHLPGWYLWATEEMLEFVRWIRYFNEHRAPDQHIRLFGMDVTAPASGIREVLDNLMAAGIRTRLDAQSLGLDLQEGDLWPVTWQRYSALTDEQRDLLASNHDELIASLEAEKSRIVAALSESAYEHMRWLAEVGRWGNRLFSTTDRATGGEIRDVGMAQTVLWILAHQPRHSKAIVWAHNLHVARSSFLLPGIAERKLEPMGVHLREFLAEDYIAIGGTFGQGRYGPDIPPGERSFPVASPETMDGALAAVGLNAFILDLHGVPAGSAQEAWLGLDRQWRAQDMQSVLAPRAAFDLVYFVKNVTRAHPTPLAQQRYQSLEP